MTIDQEWDIEEQRIPLEKIEAELTRLQLLAEQLLVTDSIGGNTVPPWKGSPVPVRNRAEAWQLFGFFFSQVAPRRADADPDIEFVAREEMIALGACAVLPTTRRALYAVRTHAH